MKIRRRFACRDFVKVPYRDPIYPWIWYWGRWAFDFSRL